MFASLKGDGKRVYLVIAASPAARSHVKHREVARLGRVDHLDDVGKAFVVDDLNDVLRRTRQPEAKRARDPRQRGRRPT